MFCTNCGSQLVNGQCAACSPSTPAADPVAALGAPAQVVQTGYDYGAGTPPPGYGAPPPGYGTPPPGYGAEPGYGAGPGYGAAGGTLTTASGEAYPEWLLSKFNWGALGFGWWWALWNTDSQRKWIGVACFVLSFFTAGLSSLGFQIYVGITGNRLAATYRRFETVDQFRATQRAWTLWAVVLLCVSVGFGALAMMLGIVGAIVGATHAHAHY